MTTITNYESRATIVTIGTQGPQGVPAVGRLATTDVTMVTGDDLIEIQNTVATTVTLPTVPTNWKKYTVKDGSGNAYTYPITLVPPSGTIDGASSFIIQANWEAVSFYFNGTNWRLI